MQQLIDSTREPSSPFHSSHSPHTTDATVYPTPTPPSEPESKKRKLDSGDAVNGASSSNATASNDAHHAKHPGHMLSNKHNVAIHEQLKQECETLAELCDKVKLWINLSMPKIEDGDNFGVQIQEDVLSELHRSQESAYNLRDAARQDYLTRAKICSKIMKYPHLEDYTLALQEHDAKQLYVARQNLYDLRSIYAILTDILHKNIDKIRTPKGNNATSMY
ncbi:proteasome activator pa28 [Daedaleopsis nitida]|nr:proteasome activator pa28 [Daedaleopsis nitida]